MRRSFALACAIVALASTSLLLASCGGGGGGYGSTQPPAGTNGELGSPVITGGGGVYQHTFATAGTFRYHCTVHPSCTTLQGVVTVVGAATPIANDVHDITFSGGSAGTYATCSSLSNQADSVHVGETVTWTNTSPLPHTVTTY